MTKSVRACWLGDSGFLHSLFYRLLQYGFVQMVPAFFPSYPICKTASRWKYPLPTPLFPCIWVLALKRIRQTDSAQPSLEIPLVLSFYHVKVLDERFFDCCGKHCVPVFISLTSTNYDLICFKIHVLHPQP
jgi:hypothetical protein